MSVELRPARINTMAPEGKDHLLRVVRAERAKFYQLIDSTDDQTWKTPTACTEWEIRAGMGGSRPLSDDAAAALVPYMFILLKYTVDADHARGVDASWGVRVSGEQGGSWKVRLENGELSYDEGSLAGCPVVFNFDPNDFVLTAFQRIQGGAPIGDQATARVVRQLFFKI